MENNNETFGQRLRAIRCGLDMLQKELARITGISTTELSRYENDKRVPGFKNMRAILSALNATSDDFVGCEMVGENA